MARRCILSGGSHTGSTQRLQDVLQGLGMVHSTLTGLFLLTTLHL
jgi:hypothetical protein